MNKYNNVTFDMVDIKNGFWKNRQDINSTITVKSVYERFSDSHRFEALECKWTDGMQNVPHVFWDSDVAKWIEGAAYIISKEKNEYLENLCEDAIDAIAKNQDSHGYFNSHYLITDKDRRFKIRDNHELYCAGHLIEAACAYYKATGREKFLKVMCRYADYIYDVFKVNQSSAFVTCGHPEIELALVRLAEITKQDKYLELSKFFVDMRGNNEKDKDLFLDWCEPSYDQSHQLTKNQTTAEGHAVRALYLYSAMADIAEKFTDEEYYQACEKIFTNIVERRMYITGGTGSSHIGEAFTIDYDLPNKIAYTETCAAIALSLFCKRMQKINVDSRYADIIEKVMYNGSISGVSLDGKSFFYENPLEIDPYFANVNTSTKIKQHMPIMERVEIFGCSCCPPNMVRFIASIGDLFYTYDNETLFVHQYADSITKVNDVTITQKTEYPVNGDVTITLEGASFAQIAIRIPGWCREYSIDSDYTLKNGYAYVNTTKNNKINIKFEMPVELIESHPRVQENAGRVAVMRGPIVYCLEGVDNGDMLRSVFIHYDSNFSEEYSEEYLAFVLKTIGYKKITADGLYNRASKNYKEVPLKFIPYFAFANRGPSEMLVWVGIK